MTKPGLSVIIPVFNGANRLSGLIERLESALKATGQAHEIILVDDGSRDDSWQCISSLSEKRPAIRGIRLMRNYGQHNALLCGIRTASLSTIITMDDDLQNPPEEIPTLLAKLNDSCDVVYGYPKRAQHGPLRRMASRITKFVLQKGMGADTAGHISTFRAFRTDLREAFVHFRGSFVCLDVLLTWSTSAFASVQVDHDPRKDGVSSYTLGKLVAHAFNMVTGFTVLPLQLASLVGFLLTLFGILILVYVVSRYLLQGTTAPGFPFLASIIAIFSGAQLCALGIIGEYLARMHFRLMDRPSYAIRSDSKDTSNG